MRTLGGIQAFGNLDLPLFNGLVDMRPDEVDENQIKMANEIISPIKVALNPSLRYL
jgi:hypothetical protein